MKGLLTGGKMERKTLDKILAWTPIPIIGEIAAYRNSIEEDRELESKGVQLTNTDRAVSRAFALKQRLIPYGLTALALSYIFKQEIIEYLTPLIEKLGK